MNEHPSDEAQPPMSDESLEAHLGRRGDRPAPAGLTKSVLARIAETTPERRWRLTVATWRPRLAILAGAAAVVLVASLLLVAPPAARVGTSPTPSPSSSASTGVTWDPTQRALTPPEFLRILATHPATGAVLIVDDQIQATLADCPSRTDCPNGQLANARLTVAPPPGGRLPFDEAGDAIPGPLALEIGGETGVVFLGSVVSNGARLEFMAQDLARRNAMGGLFVIPAWVHRAAVIPCPTIVPPIAPLPTSELGLPAPEVQRCSGGVFLTDTDPGPAPYAGVGDADPNAFLVQSEAYLRFASDPAADGSARRGVFLVRDWAGYGEILSGLQPIGIPDTSAPSTTPSAAPTESTPPASPSTSAVMSLDELMRAARSGGLPPGSLIAVDVPASAVSDRWAPGAVHSCPQLCPEWRITSGDQVLSVAVSMQQEPMPARPVGDQAFLVEPDGSLRALGPVAAGQDGGPLDPSATAKVTGLAVVHGWLRIGPAVPCPAPLPAKRTGLLGETLGWSQCPGTWILPSDTDPWAGPPNQVINSDGSGEIRTGDSSVPTGTIHVQDGATDSGLGGEGLWLVRAALEGCPKDAFCVWDTPPTGVTWWELVGPVLPADGSSTEQTPAPTPSPPAQPVSPTVWTSAELRSVVINGPLAPGTVAIVDATIRLNADVPSHPARGDAIGVIEDLPVFWGSDASLGGPPTSRGRFAVRVRANHELDYLGPAALDATGSPFTGPTIPIGGTIGPSARATLYVVHGWSFLAPPARCAALLPLASAQHQVTGLDGQALSFRCPISYILPSAASQYHASSDGYSLEMPDGTLVVQSGALPTTTVLAPPVEGVFLVRYIPCPVTPAFDACDVLPTTPGSARWELVGQVDSPAPVSP